MKTAIQIVREAYAYAGICPTSSSISAEMSEEGLGFLNELLYSWNMDNNFPFTNNTVDARVIGGQAVIAPDSETFRSEIPAFMQKVFWRNGSVWESVHRLSYENIWTRRASGATLPSFYAFSLDSEGRGIITFDCENGNFLCRIIYNRSIPQMDYNSRLAAPPQYEQLLKYGVAVKVCTRYGMPEDVTRRIEGERDSIMEAVKKANSFAHEVNLGYKTAFVSPSDLVNGAYRL